jgi:hypothetical protein
VSSSYAAGWPLSRPGVRFVEVVPDQDAPPWRRAVVPFATSEASWSAVMLAAIFAVRRSSLPVPIAAVLLGGAVVVADSLLVELVERAKTRAAEAPATPAGEDEGSEFPA